MVDDQLRRAFDTLSDRLRGEMDRQVQAALDELAASAREEREAAVAAAIAAASAERDRAVAAAAASADEHRDEAVAAAVTAASAKHEQALASAHAERDEAVAAAVAAARAEREAAVAAAQAEAAQAAAATPAAPTTTDLIIKLAEATRAMSQASSLTDVLDSLIRGAALPGATASVWLVRGEQLEFWRASDGGERASIAIDADDPASKAARTRMPVLEQETLAFPLTLAGDAVAVLTTESSGAAAPSPYAIEVLALHASRALEAITAFKTARALTRQSADKGSSAAEPASTTGEADGEEHASARRYAKLLVSEIKLYHEAEVVSGRRDRDLATRLGGEISRARAMYEQRVPADVRRQADYFHDELVRTLANGDPALLEVRS